MTTDPQRPGTSPGLANPGTLGQQHEEEKPMTDVDVDVDGALDAGETEIRNALEALTLAGDQLRRATAGLPAQALTWPQTLRRAILVAAVAVAQRALKDALDGRAGLSDVERGAQRLAGDPGAG